MAELLTTDGACTIVAPAQGKKFTLKELQAFVGGYIECIHMGDRVIVIDEEGKLKGKAVNEQATAIWYLYLGKMIHDYIVGDALVCDLKDISDDEDMEAA